MRAVHGAELVNGAGGPELSGAGPLESAVVFGGRGFANGSLYLAKALPSGLHSLLVEVAVMDAAHAAETPVSGFPFPFPSSSLYSLVGLSSPGYLSVSIGPLSALEMLAKEPLRIRDVGQEVGIPETLPLGSFVLPSLISVVSPGSAFRFRLLSGAPHVEIEEDGCVLVAASLDDVRVINVTVGVSHEPTGRSTTATTLVRVNPVNNHAPIFSQVPGPVREVVARRR